MEWKIDQQMHMIGFANEFSELDLERCAHASEDLPQRMRCSRSTSSKSWRCSLAVPDLSGTSIGDEIRCVKGAQGSAVLL
jgi:hypothetical protein